MPDPTTRQMIVLAAIAELVTPHLSPSFRMIAEKVGARSVRSITEHVQALRRKGLLVPSAECNGKLKMTIKGTERLKGFDVAAARAAISNMG
jgi:SOS-response transcriptional repressor LexA